METTKMHQQELKVYNSFNKAPKTMLQVSIETGILRANICRYIASFEKVDKVFRVRKGIYPITKHPATFFTTNKEVADGRI